MELKIAFLNCYNLYHPKTRPDWAAQGKDDLSAKTRGLADTLGRVFEGQRPDIVGLCEVSDEKLGQRIGDEISPGTYGHEWSGDPPERGGDLATSLMLLYDPLVARRTAASVVNVSKSSSRPRDRWMAAELQLKGGSQAAFWFAVNHWKSLYGGGKIATQPDRMRSAWEIGKFFVDETPESTDNMILVGDFNCEPWDRPFHDQQPSEDGYSRLQSVRERALVLRKGNKNAHFYNPMWRLACEPDPWEVASVPGYALPRPMGTFLGTQKGSLLTDPTSEREWYMWDQIMVSKHCLQGGALTLLENTVRIVKPANGASDHFAIGAIFEY